MYLNLAGSLKLSIAPHAGLFSFETALFFFFLSLSHGRAYITHGCF